MSNQDVNVIGNVCKTKQPRPCVSRMKNKFFKNKSAILQQNDIAWYTSACQDLI